MRGAGRGETDPARPQRRPSEGWSRTHALPGLQSWLGAAQEGGRPGALSPFLLLGLVNSREAAREWQEALST